MKSQRVWLLFGLDWIFPGSISKQIIELFHLRQFELFGLIVSIGLALLIYLFDIILISLCTFDLFYQTPEQAFPLVLQFKRLSSFEVA
jgi:hypothetical protein